jgi:long-chain acyl-CoA synthetase
MIPRQAEKYGEREAYRFCWRKEGEWLSTSWSDFSRQVDIAGRALAALGIQEGAHIAICSPNTPQILITEYGAFQNRVAVIPLYAASSQGQFDFIVDNGEASLIFVGDSHQYALAYEYHRTHPGKVVKIIVFKNDGIALREDDTTTLFWDDFVRIGMEAGDDIRDLVKERIARGVPSDMATLIYTSGTTGEPKGVEILHSNYDAAIEMHLDALTNVSDEDLSMSFLPMSHILEKAWSFFCLAKGIRIAVNYDPRNIQQTIHEVHPTIMCCVPRFWEKVYVGVRDKISSMSWMQRMIVRRALKVGRKRNIEYLNSGRRVPSLLEREYQLWDKKIFSMLRNAIGIPNPNMFPTAGAPLSPKICEFVRSVGIGVKVGYGLSETTATVTCFPETGYELGSVGKPLPGIDVKISPDGEILVKAPTVTPGYYLNEEANKAAFTEDGYFRTGDAGYFTENGSLVLTERIKDLFKTANGKYVAPQALESRLAENKYIDEVAVIGNERKFVTALIVPNYANIRKWAQENGIDSEDTAVLVKEPKLRDFILSEINKLQGDMASYEQIKRICLLPVHFSVMNGEVTNTMKVRRNIVAKRYAKEIEAMYQE